MKSCLALFLLVFIGILQSQTIVNIGGIFDPLYPSEYYAFLEAIEDINSGNLFNGIIFNASYIIQSSSSNIKETANMLSRNVSIVIGPRDSKTSEQLSPLFELTRTPYISYRASGSILSNRNTFPYFIRTVPDVSDIGIPIIKLFNHFGWEQSVLIHSSGIWGRGLNFLVHVGVENGIIFKAVEIPESYTISQIITELKELAEYEIFILHVPDDQRAKIYEAADNVGLIKEGIAWFGTEDVAVQISSETTETKERMEGTIAIRPKTPISQQATDLLTDISSKYQSITINQIDWYSYFVYDAVIFAAYSLNYMVNELNIDIGSKSSLPDNQYFGNIESYLTFGTEISDILLNMQLATDWTITGSLYLMGNTRRMPYELVNLQNGIWTVIAYFNWNATYIDNIISNNSYCDNLANIARSNALGEYTELTGDFAISNCSLSNNFTSTLQCNQDIRIFFDKCFRNSMGLNVAYTSSETSDDQSSSNWIYSTISNISWSGSTNNIPIGAQFSTNNPLKVLVHIIEPWGKYTPNMASSDDDNNVILGYSGFLPTLWNFIIKAHGLNCEYFDGSSYSQQDALSMIHNGSYDVALGAFTITSSRSSYIRFFHQFYGGGQRILTFDPNAVSGNSWFFLIPFSNQLWFIWLCAIIVVAHLLWIMEWDTPTFRERDDFGKLRRMSYQSAILEALTISTSVLYYTHDPPRGKHSRWFIAVWEYIVLILISAYTANMTSFITNSSAADSVIDDELSLHLEDSKVITIPNTASADILKSANITYTPCETPDICLEMMYDSLNNSLNITEEARVNAFVYDDINVEYWARTSIGCQLITGGAPFNSFSAAIATRFDYIPINLLTSIDLLIIKLWSNGTISQWMEQYIFGDYPCDAFEGAVDETTPLDVLSFWYLWLFIGGGSIIFCTVVICTVERSQTPIDQQLAELNKLVQSGNEQITRVGTLSSTEQQQPEIIKQQQTESVDLYSGDLDTKKQKRSSNDVKELQKTISDSTKNKNNKTEEIEMQTITTDQKIEEEEVKKEEEPQIVKKEKTQEKLQALSTLAMSFDPFQEAFKKQESRSKTPTPEPRYIEKKQDNNDNKNEWSKSYSIKFEYDEVDKNNTETPLLGDNNGDDNANYDVWDSINDNKQNTKQKNDAPITPLIENNNDDENKSDLVPKDTVSGLSDDDITEAFDGDNNTNNLDVVEQTSSPNLTNENVSTAL